jgi:hypothetical protein
VEYFWFYRPSEAHPPPAIRSPDDLQPFDRLSISCTQTPLTTSQQKALVDEWCRVLPTLDKVRLLWFVSRVPQALFNAACQVPGLEGLYVKWSGIKAVDAILDADALQYLHIGSSPGLESLGPISKCYRLKGLGLENIRRIRDLTPLASLTGLVELAVDGSTWKTQYVDTLEPIGSLTGLRYLSLVNLRSNDRSLRPLFTLRRLETFHVAQWWDAGELDELRRLNPGLAGQATRS